MLISLLTACGGVAFSADLVVVRGTITDVEANEVLAGVTIVIEDSAGRAIHTSTGPHGIYSAIGLSSGRIEVSVERQGYEPESERCEVRSGDTLRLDFGLVTHLTNIARRHFRCAIEPRTSDLYQI